MITVKENCNDCVHKDVCKNKGVPDMFSRKISETMFGYGPNDDYGIEYMSDHYCIGIDISCKNFRQDVAVRKGI